MLYYLSMESFAGMFMMRRFHSENDVFIHHPFVSGLRESEAEKQLVKCVFI